MFYKNVTEKMLVVKNYLVAPGKQVYITPRDEERARDFINKLIEKGKLVKVETGEYMKANGKAPANPKQIAEAIDAGAMVAQEIIEEKTKESPADEISSEQPEEKQKESAPKKRGRPNRK